MLIVISPAKALDFESKLATDKFSEPAMLDRSSELVDVLAAQSPEQIGKLMSLSEALSELNFERFQDWQPPFTPQNARPAILAFNGDTYIGMDAANSFSQRDFTHAQKTLRILSGLYGVLRPLDLIQPYRLEMGSKLGNPVGKNLYEFWGETITNSLNESLAASPGPAVLINCASNEYFKAVRPKLINGQIITPSFLDPNPSGEYKMISFFAKQARGAMAAWLIQNRVKSIREITSFDSNGYQYSADRSTPTNPVFLRPTR
jgi:cytoplasmic iron level regulating protein YaaA (DUF328/UPF0246 family)